MTHDRPSPGGPTILLVDDDPGVLRLVEMLLERDVYVVLTASEPVTALQHLRTHTPALLIVDMHLPGLHGLELLQLLRGASGRVTPAIAITGGAIEPDEVQANGFVALVRKPFNPKELIAAVRDNLP